MLDGYSQLLLSSKFLSVGSISIIFHEPLKNVSKKFMSSTIAVSVLLQGMHGISS